MKGVPLLLIVTAGIMFYVSTRLWKWYDRVVVFFPGWMRIADLATWLLLLAFCLFKYQQIVLKLDDAVFLARYLNFYSWCSMTVLGFVIIGVLRFIFRNSLLDS